MGWFAGVMFFVVAVLFAVGVYALATGFDGGGEPSVALPWGTVLRGLFAFVVIVVAPFALFMAGRRG